MWKYWTYSPTKRKDTGEILKKPWRKAWYTSITIEDRILRIQKVLNYKTIWVKKVTHPDNIKEWVKPWIPMNIIQACREVGINQNQFYRDIKYAGVEKAYEKMKVDRRVLMKEMAEGNIANALSGNLNLSDKDLVDYSFRMLEKTDKAYNPKIEIEAEIETINLEKSSEELMEELLSLIKQ